MTATTTDWIVPGAAVVVYRSRPQRDDHPQRSTVAKVARKSFTVDGVDERIQLDTMKSKTIGGTWSGWCYVVVAPDDPKVARLDAAARRGELASAAVAAVNEWNTGHARGDRAKVQDAIDALTALRDAL